MPPSSQESSSTENETQDIADLFSTLEDGEDPILKMIQYDEEKNGNLKLQNYKHLWPMIKFLHDRLNTIASENKVLKDNNKTLKEEIMTVDKKRADLQDEYRVYKQTVSARESSHSNQLNQPLSYAYVTGNGDSPKSNLTSTLSFQAGSTGTAIEQSAPGLVNHQPATVTQTLEKSNGSQRHAPMSNGRPPLLPRPLLLPPTDPAYQTPLSTGQSSAGADASFTEVSYARKRRQSQPVIRGILRIDQGDEDQSHSGLFNLLKLDHQPFRDFLIRGIKNVKDTPFKDADGQPDVRQYSDAIRKQISDKGIRVRFVKLFVHREGDLRGTTSARVGSYATDQKTIMNPSMWPPNITVRTWQFDASNTINNVSKNLQ